MKSSQLTKDTPLLLGSQSARRRDILSGLGVPIVVRSPDTDEDVGLADPAAFLERVVADKLGAVRGELARGPYPAVLVADTIVVLERDILGKPRDTEHAAELIGRLAGRTHTVFTRYSIATPSELVSRTVESRVSMRPLSAGEARRYAETGEGLDKAGAYAIQGIGAFLVRAIEGSYTNVVGLPACEVVLDLQALGLVEAFP